MKSLFKAPEAQRILQNKWMRELILPLLATFIFGWLFIKTRNQVGSWPLSGQLIMWPLFTAIIYFVYKKIGIPNFPSHYRDARQMGWIRIVVTFAMLVLAWKDGIMSTLILPEDYAYYWYGPIADLYKAFPNIFQFRNPDFVFFIQWGTRISLLFAFLGLFTRLSLIISTLFFTNFYFIEIVYTHFFSSGYLTLILLFFLCFIPCSSLSVDEWINKRFRNKENKYQNKDFGPLVYACFATYGVSYFLCGLSKARLDPYWASSNNMKKYIAGDAAAQIDRTFGGLDLIPDYVQMGGPDILFWILGTTVLVAESGALMVLFSNWARWIFPPMLMCFHFGTLLFQKFIFQELVISALMFIPITVVLPKITQMKKEPSRPLIPMGAISLVLSCLLVSHVASGWLAGRKLYPIFNSWNMYAYSGYAESTWYNFYYLNLSSGKTVKTDLTEVVDFLSQAKWHSISYWPRDEEETKKLTKLLSSYSKAYNKMFPDDPVESIDFVHWTWDFVNDYASETHGDPTKALRFNVHSNTLENLPISKL